MNKVERMALLAVLATGLVGGGSAALALAAPQEPAPGTRTDIKEDTQEIRQARQQVKQD